MQGITSFQLITYMNVHQPVTVHMTVLLGIACNTCDGLRWVAFKRIKLVKFVHGLMQVFLLPGLLIGVVANSLKC